MKVSMRSFAETEKFYYFITMNIPCIFGIDKLSNKVFVECNLSEIIDYNSSNYMSIYQWNNSLVLVSEDCTQDIIRYDIESKKITIIFRGSSKLDFIGVDSIIHDNFVFIIGLKTILRINMNNNDVCELTEWYISIRDYLKDEGKFALIKGCVVDDKLIFLCAQADVVILINYVSGKTDIKNLNLNYKGYCSISQKTDCFWCLSYTGRELIKLSDTFELLEEYKIDSLNDRVVTENLFRGAYILKNAIFLPPWRSTGIVKFDTKKGKQKIIYDVKCDDFACTYAVVGGESIKMVIQESNQTIIMDVSDEGIEEFVFSFTPETVRDIYKATAGRYLLSERNLALSDFLKVY